MKIVAYGSLLNLNSLERTLGRKAQLTPIMVSGVKRIFNAPFDGYSFLNIALEKGSVIEAACFELSDNEVEKFKEREAGSILYEVMNGYYVFYWESRTSSNLPVSQSYIDVCESGAEALGINFWKNTERPATIINDLERPLYML